MTENASSDDMFVAAAKRIHSRSLRATVASTLVMIGVISAFLIFSGQKLSHLSQAVEDKQHELVQANNQLTQTRAELRSTQLAKADTEAKLRDSQEKLKNAADLTRFLHPLTFEDVKGLASRYRGAGRLLIRVTEPLAERTGWGYANNLREGFTSPGFASFLLGFSGQGDPSGTAQLDKLPVRPAGDEPHSGDLIRYAGGYAMFYFPEIEGHGAFVIGMTPFGIGTLAPDFAPRVKTQITPFSE